MSDITQQVPMNEAVAGLQTFNNQPRAILYLFSPKFMPNQVARTHTYQFNGEFRQDLQNNLQKSISGAPFTMMDTMMPASAAAKSAIMPSATGIIQNLSPFSDFWTFLLVIDNYGGLDYPGAPVNPTRHIYSGYVIDEPVTRDITGRLVHNPSAYFTTMHYTAVVMNDIITPNGSLTKPVVSMDYDYCAPMTAQQISSDGTALYDLQLSSITNSIVSGADGSFSYHPVPLVANNRNVQINSDMNSPVNHLSKLVNSFVDSYRMLATPMMEDNIFASDEDVFLSTLSSVSGSPQPVLTNLDPATPISFGDLDYKLPMLQVVTCAIPKDLQYTADDLPSAPTRRNVLSNVVATSLPPILTKFGISEISFRYNSYAAMNTIDSDNFAIFGVAMLYNATPGQIESATMSLFSYLKCVIFPIILSNAGHFDLMVNCSLCGSTLVNLNLLDEMEVRAMQETNNMLGGLNSALIGNSAQFQNNASELMTTVMDVKAINGLSNNLLY